MASKLRATRIGRDAPARFVLVAVLLISCLSAAPSQALAQLRVGGHLVSAQDAFDGTLGIGVRAGVEAPILPFAVMASGEYFFADCPASQPGCGLYGLTVDAHFRFVFPLVRPYVSAGLAYRNIDPSPPNEDESVIGPAAGLGVEIALSGVRIFGETRYEFVDAPEKQFLWRLGALFDVF